MLTDGQIERYSRQILLPEVGGRGQERLLAARVALGGERTAATMAATLLGRAGIGTLNVSAGIGPLARLSPDCRLGRSPGPIEGATADLAVNLIDLTATGASPASGVLLGSELARQPFILGLRSADRILVVTLVGRPCARCWGQVLAPGDLGNDSSADEGAPSAHALPAWLALGALAANEALRVLLAPPAAGRLTTVRFRDGRGVARELATDGCSCCAGAA